jgi:putative ABC transport system permease protein
MIRWFAPRWRKVIRDIWSNKPRTILVVLSIAVGVFAIGVVTGARQVFIAALNKSYNTSNPANGTVFVEGEFGDDLIEAIRSMREVAIAEGERNATLRYRQNETEDWNTIELVSVDDFKEKAIGKVIPKGGEWPPPDKQMVMELTSLEWLGGQLGDTLWVETPDGKIRSMPIVGVGRYQSGPPASVTGTPTAFVNRDTLEWLGESRNFNRLAYTVAKNPLDKKHIEAVGELIRNKIENSGLEVIFIRIPNPGEHPLNTVLQPLLLILTGLGGLALFLSGFLVINIISAILAQQTRQIGMMKSIGAQQSQIIALYLVTVVTFGLMALVIAIPLGAAGAWGLTLFLADFFNVEIERFTLSGPTIVIQAAIALLAPILAGIFPIITGTRITVQEAISDYGLGKGHFGTNWLDRLLQKLRGLSRPVMISLRNTFRRKTRLTLTLFTLTLAGTTFITIYSLRDSMLATLDNILSLWQFDIVVNFEDAYRTARINQVLADMPEIEATESWGSTSVRRIRADGSESDNITLTAPPVNTQMLRPQLLAGRWLVPGDANALVINTDFIQDEPDVKVGDEIILQLGAAKKTPWLVVGIIQGATIGSALYTNYDYYSRLVNEVGQARELQIVTTSHDSASQTALAKQLEIKLGQAGLDVVRVFTISEMRSRVEFFFNFLLSFLLSMAVVLAIVGGLGLSGTMSINVLERVREIGVMRAVGASDWIVLQVILVEGLVIGLISWFTGSLLAFPLSRILSDQLGLLLLENPLRFSFSIFGLLLWLVVAMVLSFLASYLPARNASRLTVREVLTYE